MIPLNRHASLRPLSREHHHALLLCWKFRQGFAKGVEPARMKKYADWFWIHYLAPHFTAEEKLFFPILKNDHPSVVKALKEHKLLQKLFESATDTEYTLRQIAFELEQHVRFEERTLFNDIQEAATPEQLELLAKLHSEEKFTENAEDMFWAEEPKDPKKEVKREKRGRGSR